MNPTQSHPKIFVENASPHQSPEAGDTDQIASKQLESPKNFDTSNLAPTPINKETLEQFLHSYLHKDAEILHDGFNNGFSLHYSGPIVSRVAGNLKSAEQNPEVVKAKLDKEVEAGRFAGPFDTKPFKNFIVSPIGIVPKKQLGEFRLIHHLSYPEGDSINSHIDRKYCTVSYTSFDAAIQMIQELGRNCKLFKMDIKNAFRLLPISPSDYNLLGIHFNKNFYFDKALPFGAAISCQTFEKFASFLEFVVTRKLTSGRLIHYLDDFLGGDRSIEACSTVMAIFNNTMCQLGVPLALEKTEGPTEVLVFLGLELDSVKMEVRIPLAKIEELVSKIKEMLSKSKAKVKDIQSLIGSLNFCCRAIPPGRPFCRRLIDAICGLTIPYYHVRISLEMRLDLHMWLCFFSEYNGISMFNDRFWSSNADVELFTDSAGGKGKGFGVYFKGHWCQGRWPEEWHTRGFTSNITAMELFPILVAITIWGEQLRNKKLKMNCDNQSVVAILSSSTSKSKVVMCIVRELTLLCLKTNILLKGNHWPGHLNGICDALSRFQMERFRRLAPEADTVPTAIPSHVWDIFKPLPQD